jgi:hypothetical protein
MEDEAAAADVLEPVNLEEVKSSTSYGRLGSALAGECEKATSFQ